MAAVMILEICESQLVEGMQDIDFISSTRLPPVTGVVKALSSF